MPIRSDMKGFPRTGEPLLIDQFNRTMINTVGDASTQPPAPYGLDLNGALRMIGNFSATGTVTSSSTVSATNNVTVTSPTNAAYSPQDGAIINNPTSVTAAAPIQRVGRFRLSSNAWDLGAVASTLQNWVMDVKNVIANPVISRIFWGYLKGATALEGYSENMSLDSNGRLSVLGNTFGAETLTNGALTSGTSWARTGDMALSSNLAGYVHSTGAGSLTQVAASLATPAKANRWYKFTYTTASIATGVTAYIDTTFAAQREYLNLASASTFTVYFRSAAAPTDFVIQLTSTAGTVNFDNLSLTECTSGEIASMGVFSGGGGTGIKIDGAGNVGILNTAPAAALDVTGNVRTSGSVQVSGASRVYSGSGAPTVSATAGDYYFRTDTPATPGQQLYVCNGATSWAAASTIGAQPTWWTGTQTAYNAIATKDANTLYLITGP